MISKQQQQQQKNKNGKTKNCDKQQVNRLHLVTL